jgi:hypothetical protein
LAKRRDMPREGRAGKEDVQGSGVVEKSGGGFTDETGQSGQGIPGISEEEEGFGPRMTKDGQAFELPVFDGGVTTFDGVTGAMVKSFPGGGTNGQVTDEADGAVGEALADVADAAEGLLRGLEGTFGGRIGDVGQADPGWEALETSLSAEPLEALPFFVEAIGGESITERA